MYHRIMVPIDLAHVGALEPALRVAADIARLYQAVICYVSVTANTPGSVARTPAEYDRKLTAFATQQGVEHGQPTESRVLISHDPVADLDDLLVKAVADIGADLVVMQTHLPRKLDALLPAHGGKVATRTPVSVLLVRS
ncbi:MAG: universal stress protein [Gammaproteobacteria bacterium]|nr:universal stress protein [Gammaproteobacteria bacterium]TVQ43639.1 MAG: universal stress protein [Gammaproteobacteria bacterium]